MEREFLASRQAGLQGLVDTILAHPMIAAHINVKRFFDENHYNQNHSGKYFPIFITEKETSVSIQKQHYMPFTKGICRIFYIVYFFNHYYYFFTSNSKYMI